MYDYWINDNQAICEDWNFNVNVDILTVESRWFLSNRPSALRNWLDIDNLPFVKYAIGFQIGRDHLYMFLDIGKLFTNSSGIHHSWHRIAKVTFDFE